MNDDSLKQHHTHIEMESHPVPVTVYYRAQFGEINIKSIRTEGGFFVSIWPKETERIIAEINQENRTPA